MSQGCPAVDREATSCWSDCLMERMSGMHKVCANSHWDPLQAQGGEDDYPPIDKATREEKKYEICDVCSNPAMFVQRYPGRDRFWCGMCVPSRVVHRWWHRLG